MKRSILILAVFISFIVASLAFINADEPKYKNLKVLKKNTTKHELDSLMRFFTMSLGERCTFCHVKNDEGKVSDFASDANPNKGTARFMMKMTAKINKKYFKDMDKGNENKGSLIQSVTCYTCHHGEGHPAVKPPMGKNGMGMPPPPGMGMPPQGMRDSMRTMPNDSSKEPH